MYVIQYAAIIAVLDSALRQGVVYAGASYFSSLAIG